MLREKYWPLVERGIKTITIRRNTHLKPGDLVEIHSGGKIRGIARVTAVYERSLEDIGEDEARKEGIPLSALIRELKKMYGRESTLKVIEFQLVETFDPPKDPERRRYGDLSPREVAQKAIELGLAEDSDRAILLAVAKTGSIREVAKRLGGLKHRRKIRKILEKYAKMLTS